MRILRRWIIKSVLEVHLPGCRERKVCATNNVGNVIQEVVYDNSQLISGDSVSAENNKVADIRFKILGNVPRNAIGHSHLGVSGE